MNTFPEVGKSRSLVIKDTTGRMFTNEGEKHMRQNVTDICTYKVKQFLEEHLA